MSGTCAPGKEFAGRETIVQGDAARHPAEDMTAQPPFEQIVSEYGPMIKRIAASYEADFHNAEELTQEILCALWRAMPSFRGDASLRTFVARIATNRAITHVKRSLTRRNLTDLSEDLPAPGDNPETRVATSEQEARLLTAVRSLPLALRQAALLTLEGLSLAETANVLGITTNAVGIRMSRAKEALRILMGETS